MTPGFMAGETWLCHEELELLGEGRGLREHVGHRATDYEYYRVLQLVPAPQERL